MQRKKRSFLMSGLRQGISRRPAQRDLAVLCGFILVAYVISVQLDLFDTLHALSEAHKGWPLDDIFAGAIVSTIGLFLYEISRAGATVRKLSKRIAAEQNAKELATPNAPPIETNLVSLTHTERARLAPPFERIIRLAKAASGCRAAAIVVTLSDQTWCVGDEFALGSSVDHPVTITSGERVAVLRLQDPTMLASVGDVAASVAAEIELVLETRRFHEIARGENRLRIAVEDAGLHVYEVDFGTRTLHKTGAEDTFFEIPKMFADLAKTPWTSVHEDDRGAAERAWEECQQTGAQFRREYRMHRTDQRDVWALSTVRLVKDGDRPPRLIGALQNITDRKRSEAEVKTARAVAIAAEHHAKEMAMHDALTGLPNRRHLGVALDAFVTKADASTPLAVVAVDLDRFKPVNDLYGHAVGDELLVKIADMLRAEAGGDGFAARLGGDEFILVLPHQSEEQLLSRLSALVASFDAPFVLLGHEVSVGVTLGVAMAPTDGRDAETLMRRADVALYRAKDEGRGRFSFFEAGMDERVHERAALENELRIAIRNDVIEPHFQALVQLQTGDVLGYEILARWPHPERGLVPPDVFIAIAEETGLIGELTMSVLRRACGEALLWPGAPRISLNISPVQLKDATLPQKLLRVLTECGFPPQRLEIEITEDALVSDFDAARVILVSLKNVGVHIALDDFGTGYSSLRHLRELPFDVLKIDRSFVQSMSDSEEARTLIKTIVSLAKNLGLGVTAEGIESAEDAAVLQALGCELGQGYLYGRPAPGAAVTEGLERDAAEALAAAIALPARTHGSAP